MNRLARIAAGAALALGLGLSAAAAQESLKLAVTDVEGLERLQTEWGPFKAALEAATGFRFEFFPVASRTAAAEALRAERVDFVVTGPAEYVVINKVAGATPLVGLGRPDYFCAIVVKADSGITRIDQLAGKKVAFDDIGSTSGHLCPMQLLVDYGLDPMRDIERLHTSRNIAHESLKRGDVAAIGVNHNSWISKARDKDTAVPPGAFRILARSGDLPNDMIVAGAHIAGETAEKVRQGMLSDKAAIIESILTASDENDKYRGMDILAVTDADYERVRQMYVTIGQPEYAEFVGE